MPEAVDYITKFYIMREFGWAETWKSLDDMSYYDYQIILACHNADSKKQTFDEAKAQFYNKEAVIQ